MSFVHLHNHSDYSLLLSTMKINKMVEKASKTGMKAIALTDNGNMFGAIEFYKAAKSNGIKPILGFEAYLSPTTRFDKGVNEVYHLTLLAKNEKGYENLLYLCSVGYLEGFHNYPRIDKEILKEHSEGIIAGSGCLNGEINKRLLLNDYDGAKRAVKEYQEIFGKENFFLEIGRHGLKEEKRIENLLIKLSLETNTPLVATNNCHYLDKEDAKAQEILLCIKDNKNIYDKNKTTLGSDEFYFKTEEEMLEAFRDNPEFVHNSQYIADMCNGELELKRNGLPSYRTPNGTNGSDYLKSLAFDGLEAKIEGFNKQKKDLYRKRLEYELEVIEQKGLTDYFLIVLDYVNYAKRNSIPVGTSISKISESLLAYCTRITNIDPIEHALVFECFINPKLQETPEVSLDFCLNRRDEVIKYLIEKYERYNVAYTICFSSFIARYGIKSVAKALFLPNDKTLETVNNLDIYRDIAEQMSEKQEVDENEQIKELLYITQKLEGVKNNVFTHSASIVISDKPLYKKCPLFKTPSEEKIAVQFPKDSLKAIGLKPFTLLGLRDLTIISEAVKQIGNGFDLNNIPLDDKRTYELLCKGETEYISNLRSEGIRNALVKLHPDNFEDLVALISLYRPTPIELGLLEEFIDRKQGRKSFEYPLPELENILKETYGLILYEEQVTQVISQLSGCSLSDADIIRQALTNEESIGKYRDSFLKSSVKNGVTEKDAIKVFNLLEKSAEYIFNKSCAISDAYISYQEAYLMAHYPEQMLNAIKKLEDQIK